MNKDTLKTADDYLHVGDRGKAEEIYRRHLFNNRKDLKILLRLCQLLRRSKCYLEAAECAYQLIEIWASNPGAWLEMGLLKHEQGHIEEAKYYILHALTINSDYLEARIALAEILGSSGQVEQAIITLDRGIKGTIVQEHRAAYWVAKTKYMMENNQVLQAKIDCGTHESEIIRVFRQLHTVPILYKNQKELEAERNNIVMSIERLLALTTKLCQADKYFREIYTYAWLTNNFYVGYQMKCDKKISELYVGAIQNICKSQIEGLTSTQIEEIKKRKEIRVGVISPHLYSHNGAWWALAWFRALHNLKNVSIYAYNTGFIEDRTTKEFIKLGKYKNIEMNYSTHKESIEIIKEDRLDMLLFTDIGMHPSTRVLSSIRLARIQCQGWGHPITSGSNTIDYFLSGELMETQKGQNHYTEKLQLLPSTGIVYTQVTNNLSKKYIKEKYKLKGKSYICSMQSTFKYSPENQDLIADYINKTDEIIVIMVECPYGNIVSDQLQSQIREKIVTEKNKDRLRIIKRTTFQEYIALLKFSLFSLDTVGWNGGNSSFQAFSVNCPVVTKSTKFMRGRHTESMLRKMKIKELSANSNKEFIAIAIKLSNDDGFNREIRNKIKKNKKKLFDDNLIQAGFKKATLKILKT